MSAQHVRNFLHRGNARVDGFVAPAVREAAGIVGCRMLPEAFEIFFHVKPTRNIAGPGARPLMTFKLLSSRRAER